MSRYPQIAVKRVYDKPSDGDGFRVLVDRLWPRGVSKDQLKIDKWMREVAPSNELRKWFSHDPAKWETFLQRYRRELYDSGELDKLVRELSVRPRVTLVYSARDTRFNQAVALKSFLEEKYSE
ncbi:MAG: DUF488 family protein [Candidatus Marsarchaeota archaeon]|nr:DUF488 family protein [Candidatus Marsarchaeota archaeon]